MLKNGEGGFVADEPTLDRLEGEGQVVARYLGGNPNGSLRDIAGITNERGNVVGPHAAPRALRRGALRLGHRRAGLLPQRAGLPHRLLTPSGALRSREAALRYARNGAAVRARRRCGTRETALRYARDVAPYLSDVSRSAYRSDVSRVHRDVRATSCASRGTGVTRVALDR